MNNLTSVGLLADEVADLLRHNNLDNRINTWISIAYQDVVSRAPTSLFYQWEQIQITSSNEYADISSTRVGTPVSLVVVGSAPTTVYMPRYVSPIDFSRIAHDFGTPTGPVEGSAPEVWTVAPRPGDNEGKSSLWIYPIRAVGTLYCNLCYVGVETYEEYASNQYVPLPYHFEHVLVWGAAMLGAKIMRPELYSLYRLEYEQAIAEMNSIMAYRPDAVPVLNTLSGPYSGTRKLQGLQWPTNDEGKRIY